MLVGSSSAVSGNFDTLNIVFRLIPGCSRAFKAVDSGLVRRLTVR
jgi:hypothetical protein